MKKNILMLVVALLALATLAEARAQNPKADSLLLNERTEGDYRVRCYRVEQPAEADYTLLYRINLASLDAKLGENPAELRQMEQFFSTLVGDSLRTVKLISITGYASPDGPDALNERLSKARTANFTTYGDDHYHLTKHYHLEQSSVAEDWSAVRSAVAQSSMPDRERVLQILDSPASHAQKESELKALPEAWDYLKTKLLPPLRRVEVKVNYVRGSIVEQRTLVAAPVPAPREVAHTAPAKPADPCDPCACPLVDEEITGIIVAYPEELQHPGHHPRNREKITIRVRDNHPRDKGDRASAKHHDKREKSEAKARRTARR